MNELDTKLYTIIREYGKQVDPQGYEDGDIDGAVMKIKQVFAFYGISEAMPKPESDQEL